MKNAMKKLMAFALVAVMLIGALPFAASAATAVPYQLVIDGETKQTGTVQADGSKTLLGHLADIYPAYSQYEFKVYLNESGAYEPADIALSESVTHVKFQLDTIVPPEPTPEYITAYVKLGANQASITLEKGATLTLNADLLASKGLNLAYDHYIMQWSCDGTPFIADGSTVTPSNGVVYVATQAPNVHDEDEGDSKDEEAAPKMYVSVILNDKKEGFVDGDYINCYLEDGHITRDDRDEVAELIAGKGIIAWEAKGYGQENTLLNFDFSDLKTPINVFPVFATNNGTTEPSVKPTEPAAQSAYAYIYVGNDNNAKVVYKYENAFSIAGAVNKFDEEDAQHYAFSYYTLAGSSYQYTDSTAVVQPGQTAHIRVKVTESKLNENKVYLQIYLNNDFNTPAKTLNVTTTASEDGLYLYGNVEDLILEYFSAKNSNGIKLDGMYESVGSWVANFLEDDKVSRLSSDEVIEAKEKTFVVYNIMVTNAKLKSSSTADSSNYKTGDQIFVPVAIMAVSACTLAAVAFYLNKKRAM